jgi:hypothetical protein
VQVHFLNREPIFFILFHYQNDHFELLELVSGHDELFTNPPFLKFAKALLTNKQKSLIGFHQNVNANIVCKLVKSPIHKQPKNMVKGCCIFS